MEDCEEAWYEKWQDSKEASSGGSHSEKDPQGDTGDVCL
jgi:hypothetical protein